MPYLVNFILILMVTGCLPLQPVKLQPVDPGRSIVKIQAISTGGKQNLGSGVVIARDTIATNCHVVRSAKRVFIIVPEGLYRIIALAAMPELDICLLKTQQLTIPAVELADSDGIHVGDDIVLSGYPLGMGRRTSSGAITALHPYRDSRIIEISTGFNHGASGGGVFDQEGKLIGLMTFMGKEDGLMHFYVIPAAWLAIGLKQAFAPLKPFKDRSFWEKGDFVKQLKQ